MLRRLRDRVVLQIVHLVLVDGLATFEFCAVSRNDCGGSIMVLELKSVVSPLDVWHDVSAVH